MLDYSQIKIGNLYRWNSESWALTALTIDYGSPRVGKIYQNDEFMVLEKKNFDNIFTIRIIFLGKEIIGWLSSGPIGLYPIEKVLI